MQLEIEEDTLTERLMHLCEIENFSPGLLMFIVSTF